MSVVIENPLHDLRIDQLILNFCNFIEETFHLQIVIVCFFVVMSIEQH
jgi:hypothetical protein